ncbi:MAG: 2-oxoacid:ferredoxin oxidoreductase subunit alpha [Acidilobus sp.]
MLDEVRLLLGGPQGAGLETSASVLTAALATAGYGVMADREYYSNIVGRHSYVHFTVDSRRFPRSLDYPVHALGAMDAETVFTHFHEVAKGGLIFYDVGLEKTRLQQVISMEPEVRERVEARLKEAGVDMTVEGALKAAAQNGVRPVGLDFKGILNVARERLGVSSVEVQRYRSGIVMTAVAAALGLPDEVLRDGFSKRFRGNQRVVEANMKVAEVVLDLIPSDVKGTLRLSEPTIDVEEMITASGNDVIGMAKIVGGVRYQSYYPITPASDESVFLEAHQSISVDGRPLASTVVFQTEDEIAAITSAIGAALTGTRAATATSGPGFSLMVEGLGWAGHNEVPLLITLYQRGGPSTGMPTRGQQGDLLFAMFAGHGEFPRIVVASGDIEEAFYDTIKALNWAERYQMPVIHLVDKYMANVVASMRLPDPSTVKLDRGKLVTNVMGPTKRFDLSSPISPRPALGSGAITWYTGDEHNEWGHISEDPINRTRMYEKRMRKLEIADSEIPPEERATLYGDLDADFLLVGWGFVKGAVLDAIDELRSEGLRGAYLHLRVFSPFPTKLVSSILARFDPSRVIDVEHNYLGQASRVIQMFTGYEIRNHIVKITGRPIYSSELASAVKRILRGESTREVLTYGE